MKLDKKQSGVPGIVNLPDPAPGKGGRKVVALALLAVLLVGGAAFWLTRDKDTREQWREQAATVIDNATSGTPLAGVSGVLRPAPPPPPPSVVSPYTAPGTLAGQNVQGSVALPSGMPGPGGAAAPFSGADMAGQPGPRVTEDSRVRPQFVESLAAYLVSRFKPGPRGGMLGASVQSVNQRFGSKLTGFADDDAGGRGALLRYAFHPTMVQGLYSLYVDRFMESIAREARARDFNAEQTHQLEMALAGRFVMLAGALESVAATPDLAARLQQIDAAARNALEINGQMAEAVFDYDQLRESGASQSQLGTAQLRVDGFGARFRRALEDQAAAQRALVSAVRRGVGQAMDDDELLFVARWVDRRLRQDPQAVSAVRASAGVLRDLARRCAQAATGTPAAAAVHAPETGATQGAEPLAGSLGEQVQAVEPARSLPAGISPSAAPAGGPSATPPLAPQAAPTAAPQAVPTGVVPTPQAPAVSTVPPASPALSLPPTRPEAVDVPVQVGGQGR